MKDDIRYIEKMLPIQEISAESSNEKNIRHGHIATIHTWWARRPLVSCRAAIFGALTKYPEDKLEQDKLTKQLIDLCKWENTNKISAIFTAQERILTDNAGHIPLVLDCFAGGGAIPLESLRLGCHTYANDLNPIANLILNATISYPQEFQQSHNGNELLQTSIIRKITTLYEGVIKEAELSLGDIYPQTKERIVGYWWARTIVCSNPACKRRIPLLKQLWLLNLRSQKADGRIAVKLLPANDNQIKAEIKIGTEIDFDPANGTIKQGNCVCPVCGQVSDEKYVKQQSRENYSEQMICVIVDDKRRFRLPNDADVAAFERVKRIFQEMKNERVHRLSIFPDETITTGMVDRLTAYGFERWQDIYNARQLVFLTKLIDLMTRQAHDKYDELFLRILFDRFIDRYSTLSVWHTRQGTIESAVSRHTMPITWDYVEPCPFSGKTGSLSKAAGYILDGLQPENVNLKPATVILGSATNMPFKNEQFDAIITDPPYYDAIGYSDLSDYFYVWQKRFDGGHFKTYLAPKTEEIIADSKRCGSKSAANIFYEEKMTIALHEMNRVLDSNGILVLVFAHKSSEAWETLIRSLLNSDFIVTASWPLKTELTSGMVKSNKAALASSFFIVCRKRKDFGDGFYEDVKEELTKTIKERLDYFWSQKVSGSDFFISAIGPAIQVFGKYKLVKKLSGETVSVTEFLNLTRQLVSEYALRQILHGERLGDIDEYTRFYVIWRWSYDGYEISFDDARKLAQALGSEPDELMNAEGLLKKNKDKVILLGPKERKKIKHLGESTDDRKPPLIDVLHHSLNLWEDEQRQDLEEYLAEGGYGKDESFWAVAQAIAEVLPDGDKEKQLLQGLLVSRSKLSGDSKQLRLA